MQPVYNKKVSKGGNMDEDDITLQSYQDDLDTSGVDPFASSAGDDPAAELGIPLHRYREELNRYDDEEPSDDQEGEPDDMREQVEDLAEGEDSDK
jgi:hypothetical protein